MDYQISENRSFLDIQTNKWVIKYFLKDGKILGPKGKTSRKPKTITDFLNDLEDGDVLPLSLIHI